MKKKLFLHKEIERRELRAHAHPHWLELHHRINELHDQVDEVIDYLLTRGNEDQKKKMQNMRVHG